MIELHQERVGHVFEEVLVDRITCAAVPLSVVSPRCVRSEWAMRELNEFWKAGEGQGGVQVRDKSRIFKVLKTKVRLDEQSPQLRSLLGYEFFDAVSWGEPTKKLLFCNGSVKP